MWRGVPILVSASLLITLGAPAALDEQVEGQAPEQRKQPIERRAESIAQPPLFTAVPDLRGHRREEASRLLEDARLILGSIEYSRPAEPVEVVIAQKPEAGQRVRLGTKVDIVLSLVLVPGLTGQPLSNAKQLLARAELRAGEVVKQESAATPETVLRQDPPAGSAVPRGSVVNVAIAVPIPPVPVPDVMGMREEPGREKLIAAGLAEGAREGRYSEQPVGTILDQSPGPGVLVPPGTPVKLVVSTGPEPVAVPDVRGRGTGEARRRLDDAGLQIGNQQNEEYDGQEGIVLRQEPIAGERVARGTAVDLIVSTPRLVPVPDLHGLGAGEARQRLDAVGLTAAPALEEASDQTAGTVLRQMPDVGTRVRRGTSVSTWVAAARPGPPIWAILVGLGAAVGVLGAYRLLRRRPERDRGRRSEVEVRAAPDDGKQRATGEPIIQEHIGLELHGDTGRQRMRRPDEPLGAEPRRSHG